MSHQFAHSFGSPVIVYVILTYEVSVIQNLFWSYNEMLDSSICMRTCVRDAHIYWRNSDIFDILNPE